MGVTTTGLWKKNNKIGSKVMSLLCNNNMTKEAVFQLAFNLGHITFLMLSKHTCCTQTGNILFAFRSEFIDSKLEIANKTNHELNTITHLCSIVLHG